MMRHAAEHGNDVGALRGYSADSIWEANPPAAPAWLSLARRMQLCMVMRWHCLAMISSSGTPCGS